MNARIHGVRIETGLGDGRPGFDSNPGSCTIGTGSF
jgi:hypothetical protein